MTPLTDNIFEHKDYRVFIKSCLGLKNEPRRNGAIKKIATHLRCHSTYVSQVLKGKAHLSHEQAIRLSEYLRLNQNESEFFVDLINFEKAATAETKNHFKRRILKQLNDRTDLQKRLGVPNELGLESQVKYYKTWVPQAIHLFCQIQGGASPELISRALNLSMSQTLSELKELLHLGVIRLKDEKYESKIDFIHLPKNSPLRAKFIANWRQKTIEDITHERDPKGIHYSSVVSLSEKTATKIKSLILEHIEETRKLVAPSPPEKIYVFHCDFYSLGGDVSGKL